MIEPLQESLWLIALATFVFAGMVKGIVGIGMPTASVSVLAQFTDPRLAIILVMVPGLVTNVWQIYRAGSWRPVVRAFAPFAVMMVIGIWFFAQFATGLSIQAVMIGIGIVIIIFVLANVITPPKIPDRLDMPAQIGIGTLAGVMGGLSAIWSPAIVIYLLARDTPRDLYMAATGFLVLLGSISLIVGYWQAGALSPQLMGQSAAMIVPTLIGYTLGEWLRSKLGAAQFRNAVLVVFFLMGLNLIRRAIVT